ncbi:hypothetical protein MAPG_02623 [Magnaporthiopsis poae ATCC 64411]|uniref:Uncharacterized protein n=1 Tax=Magnaporthiopsis poae (strain ATCC 64411 / 73-15) TaxID=644358 RepID=A0A0C4DRV6_MAGP6|nr:hypothetical protein MAPG_02623 [Magnaporthiopsis poae ATCC 64411]
MPSTIDNEMPLLGNGNMHWVTIRRDASEVSRLAVAALLRRRGSPGKKTEEENEEEEEKEKEGEEEEEKKKDNKKQWLSFSFGWFVGPPSTNESTDTPPPCEAAGQLSQGFQVIRGARVATLGAGSGSSGAGTETEKKSETRKGKLLSIVPRALNFIRRKCGARRKAPPDSAGESLDDEQRASHSEEQASVVQGSQGSQGQIFTVYPVSGAKLAMTDGQLNQAKDNMGLPTPAGSELALVAGSVGGSSTGRWPVFAEAFAEVSAEPWLV